MAVPVTDGLVLQLDANAIEGLNDNDTVTTWEDLSGEENDATASGAPTYKTNILDGKPVVRFDGVDDWFDLVSGAMGLLRAISGTTVITLVRFTGLTPDRKHLFFANTPSGTGWTRLSSTYDRDNFEVAGRRLDEDTLKQLFGNVTPATATWYIKSCVLNHNNDTATIYLDGSSIGSGAWQGTGLTSDTDSVYIRVGGDGTYSATLVDGDIAEMLVYDRALTTQEREQVEEYLGVKWLGWTPSFTTGYILERRIGEGEWVEIARLPVGSVGQLQEPLTLSGTLNTEEQKIIVEGR